MTERLHFLSEARLAQTAEFVDACNASLARLAASGSALPAPVLQQFAALEESAAAMRTEMLAGIEPLRNESRPGTLLFRDPAARRLLGAAEELLVRLDEMIARLARLPLDHRMGEAPKAG
ncbi:hypothetical protein [Dongia sp.]|uniref:hypothetical protein n=1 Tax=Dongia sp. TaxID=1977262 RepID=UPI0035B1DF34